MKTSLCHNGPSYVSSLGYRMLMLAAVCGGVDRISVGGCIRESESRCAHRSDDALNWPSRESYAAPEGAYYGYTDDCDGLADREEFYERLAAEDEQRREAMG